MMFRAFLIFFVIVFVASIPFLSNWISIRSGEQILKMKSSEDIIGNYIDNHPERIISSIEKYHLAREKAVVADVYDRMSELASAEYPTIGNPDAKISIVEFFDYTCGYCKMMTKTVEKIVGSYNVKYVLRDFPIRDGGLMPSKYGMAVYMMDKAKFGDFYFKAMQLKKYTEESLNALIDEIGIDKSKFLVFLAEKTSEINALISKTTSEARNLRISGTPAFIIGDAIHVGYIEYADMASMIDDFKRRRNITG